MPDEESHGVKPQSLHERKRAWRNMPVRDAPTLRVGPSDPQNFVREAMQRLGESFANEKHAYAGSLAGQNRGSCQGASTRARGNANTSCGDPQYVCRSAGGSEH